MHSRTSRKPKTAHNSHEKIYRSHLVVYQYNIQETTIRLECCGLHLIKYSGTEDCLTGAYHGISFVGQKQEAISRGRYCVFGWLLFFVVKSTQTLLGISPPTEIATGFHIQEIDDVDYGDSRATRRRILHRPHTVVCIH